MSQSNRIPGGRCVDYGSEINFRFNGRSLTGYKGDTLASALLANDIKIIGRSFKYGRPRGVMSAGSEEPNAILQLGATPASQVPNVRATQQQIFNGLTSRTTNGWPSVDFDVMSLIGHVAGKLMPPGFYYKTLMFPRFLWHTYEWIVRRGAGIGIAPTEPDPDRYDKINRHCDLLIIGAGPAGLAAAHIASRTSARVILLDEHDEPGGTLRYSNDIIEGLPGIDWVKQITAELNAAANVDLLTRTTAVGYHDQNFIVAHERRTDHLSDVAPAGFVRQRVHRIRARHVILATGAHERPLVFANNDVPGCMQASAVSAYINQYGVRPGNRLVLMTTNDNGYEAAFDWIESGGESAVVVDIRTSVNGELLQRAATAGIRTLTGSAVFEVKGKRQVKAALVCGLDSEQNILIGNDETIPADIIASSGGWSPVVHLSCHTGIKPDWREDIAAFVPGTTNQKMLTAGAVSGDFSLSAALRQGASAAATILADCGFDVEDRATISCQEHTVGAFQPCFHIPHRKPTSRSPAQFVDYQLDVTAAAIELATREGFESIEHVKRYTALGFGTDQGKISNVNGIAIAARSTGRSIAETGTTMFRPNYTPVSFGAMAGRDVNELFQLKRYTAMQPWHEQAGALFEDVGQWKRPWYYPQAGESLQDAINRECLAVRNGVGILDASTLGKIDIQGPDAREFLNRIYTNAWMKLGVGKCRYGLMCGEDGMVMDDGVTACLADNHFVMTTTTGGAARVLEWLELWHQTEWPELGVYFNTVTDHWATATLSGPGSRALLAELTDLDLDPTNFPFMDWRQAMVADIPARVFRISFTGELSYEINVNANYGLTLWRRLIEAGEKYNLTPYGTETMHVLRAEKGFIIVGQDTDGSVTPEDLGMEWAIARRKKFSFIGRRGMAREDCQRQQRKQLVGLLPVNGDVVLPEGSQIVFDKPHQLPAKMVGHVTSSYYSAALEGSFALALVQGGLDRMGETVQVSIGPDAWETAEITASVFYDPKGEQQHVQ